MSEDKAKQVGCGYCAKEATCTMRNHKINKAKQGCPQWQHWQDTINPPHNEIPI